MIRQSLKILYLPASKPATMRLLFFIFFCATVSVALGQKKTNAKPDNRLAGIDTALNRLLDDWHAAGFAVAVVEKDKIVYSKGFGFRDLEAKKPVTPNTLFAIGSSTKAFTSSLMGMLEKEGELKLDDIATDHLSDLKFFNRDMDANVTIRDLMCHRTGLPRHDYSWYLFTSESRDSLMRRIRYQEPTTPLRSSWQYNNFMFLLQGMIAEKYYKSTWEKAIRDQILTPLGMKRSVMSISELEKDEDASKGYTNKNDSVIKATDYYNIDAMGPAGSINSSVTEMANWVITWIQGGKFQGKEIIPAGYVQSAISSQMVVGGATPGKENPDLHFSNYGLGWFLSSYRGHYRVEHGGNIDGFSANVAFFPSDSIGIIVLSNQNGSSVPNIARNIIADRMLRLKYINWSGNMLKNYREAQRLDQSATAKKESSRIKGTKPSHALDAYEGIYEHPGYGKMELFVEGDSLMGRVGKEKLYFRHYHYDVFDIKGYDKVEGLDTSDAQGPRMVFHTAEDGKIDAAELQLEPTLKPLVFNWQPRAKPLDSTSLAKYTGLYKLGEMTVTVEIRDAVLWIVVPGQPDYETVFTGNHTFNLKALKGFSVTFQFDGQEKASAAKFVQPNGVFTAKRKE